MHFLFPGSLGARPARPVGIAGATLADLEEILGLTSLPNGEALAADLLAVWRPGEGVRNNLGGGVVPDPILSVDAADITPGDTD